MFTHRARIAFLAVVVASLVTSAVTVAAPAPEAATSKIAPRVLQDTANGAQASFLVVLKTQADLSGAAALPTKAAKGRYVFDTLNAVARQTQAPLKAYLDQLGVSYKSHWLVNMLTITGDRALVNALAARDDVARVDGNPLVKSAVLPAIASEPFDAERAAPTTIEWNVSRVQAPRVWSLGYTGQGIVLGDADTGQQWDHPALKPHYRGWNGTTADHNYNWWDATNSSQITPVDPYGHGTHTAGIMVGDDGGTNQIGVAPGAQWIGCRNMDASGTGSPDRYTTCFEFMMAPWDLNGQNPNPALAVDAINNSWTCPASEGCSEQTLYQIVQTVEAAGIVPVFAAGNDGSACKTVGISGPPAEYDVSYAVGATTKTNTLASFSSRGPVTVDGSNRIKPDIVAPGDSVRSSYPPNIYVTLSGTSMAAPHITGIIALVHSAKPQLIGDVAGTETLLDNTAKHINSAACNSSGTYPNNLYGWGFVNAFAAVKSP